MALEEGRRPSQQIEGNEYATIGRIFERSYAAASLNQLLNAPVIRDRRVTQEFRKSGFAPSPEPFLIDEGQTTLSDEDFWENAIGATIRAYVSRKQRGRGLLYPEYLETIRFTPEDVRFVGLMDVAKRVVNGIKCRELLLPNGKLSKYGWQSFRARENSFASDHNYNHDRRFERIVDAILLNDESIRRMKGVEEWLVSLYWAVTVHDVGQRIAIHRNLEEGRWGLDGKSLPVLDTKQGHDLEGGLIALVQYKRLAEEFGIPEKEALRIAKGVLYMCAGHHEPDIYSKAIYAQEPAYADEDIFELYNRYKQGTVDRRTISPYQWLRLLRIDKMEHTNKKNTPVTRDTVKESEYTKNTLFGFSPVFEEDYSDVLVELFNDNTPIFPNLTTESHEALNCLSDKVFKEGDVIEFVLPAREAFFRTLSAYRSRKRALFWGDKEGLLSYVNDIKGRKNQEAFPPETDWVDLMMYVVTDGDANIPSQFASAECDMGRKGRELTYLGGGGKYLTELKKDTAVTGVLTMRDIGRGLMKADIRVLDRMLLENCVQIGVKFLQKSNYSDEGIAEFRREHPDDIYFVYFIRDQLEEDNTSLGERYQDVVVHALTLGESILDNLGHKPLSQHGSVRKNILLGEFIKGIFIDLYPSFDTKPLPIEEYSDEQRLLFEQFIERMLTLIVDQYGVTTEELEQYELLAAQGKYPPRYPCSTYVASGMPEQMHTFRKAPKGLDSKLSKFS